MRMLIISEIPTHPTNEGNRWGILAQANTFKNLGVDVHYLYCGLKNDINTQDYWGENYHFFKISFLQRARQALIKFYRINFCDWYWKCDDLYLMGLTDYVNQLNKIYDFDSCIVNYFYLTKLFDKINISKKALFTHDCFTFKNIAIGSNSYLSLKPNDEAKALQRSPHIFAVQDAEQLFFKMLSPMSHVYNIYSKYEYHPQPIAKNKNILFLSGKNIYNINGIIWFIEEVFPQISNKFPEARLLIGGSICNFLTFYSSHKEIRLLGYIDNLVDFYIQGDVSINPVFQGTGLKIKTFESISFDKVTLVHPHSTVGIYKKDQAPLFVSDKAKDWVSFLDKIWSNSLTILSIKEKNRSYLEDMNEFILNEYKRFLNA